MKLFSFLVLLSLAAGFTQTWGPDSAGQTFLVMPDKFAMPQRVVRSLTSKASRSWTIPQRFVRTATSLVAPKLVRSWETHPGMSTENVYNQEFTQQRVLRTPISKTITVLPNEVNRITRNIQTHMPMVHERVKNFYNIEDINKKKIVHHFVEPVENKHWGTRQGRSFQQGTEHQFYKKGYHPDQFIEGAEEVNGEDVMVEESDLLNGNGYVEDADVLNGNGYIEDAGVFNGNHVEDAVYHDNGYVEDVHGLNGNGYVEDSDILNGNGYVEDAGLLGGDYDLNDPALFSGSGWEVLEEESCKNIAAGQPVRPQAVCMSNGSICDDALCNKFEYPKDMVC